MQNSNLWPLEILSFPFELESNLFLPGAGYDDPCWSLPARDIHGSFLAVVEYRLSFRTSRGHPMLCQLIQDGRYQLTRPPCLGFTHLCAFQLTPSCFFHVALPLEFAFLENK